MLLEYSHSLPLTSSFSYVLIRTLIFILAHSSFFPSSADLLHAKPPPLPRKPTATTNTQGPGLGSTSAQGPGLGKGLGSGQDDNEGNPKSSTKATKAIGAPA